MTRTRQYIIIICGVLLIITGCKDTVYKSSVPTYPVEMRLNIEGKYIDLVPANPGAYYTFTKPQLANEAVGFAGILVCVGTDMQYYAFDLACPSCLSQFKPLEIDGMFATCPLCGEQYEYLNGMGTPTQGIVREYLRKYHTSYSAPFLHIYQ